ncbi:unnamed protein product [Fraxinus pennsylvanica]|uniref:Transposase-associated domain-containing protein n=1 Tax=Fraxinus pennsylvanica TaxID=56036 RepID=A0AAD2E6I1_9LAMI|nr:unnamed protein product [Fraxinus pennsylvanica]
MDRSWIMLRNRLDKRYQDGLRNFLAFAHDNIHDGTSTILCPCQDYRNTTFLDISAVKHHLFRYGFDISYQRWSFHGDSSSMVYTSGLENSNAEVVGNDFEDEDDMIEILNDLGGANIGAANSSVEPEVEQIGSQGWSTKGI